MEKAGFWLLALGSKLVLSRVHAKG